MDQVSSDRDIAVQQCRARKRTARLARVLEWGCYTALAINLFGLLGGWELLWSTRYTSRAYDIWLWFPFNIGYWIPLLIPFTTYIIIARWTGDTMFRNS